MRFWSNIGPAFVAKSKTDLFDQAKQWLLNPAHALQWRWCKRYNRPLNDPLLLSLTAEDLMREEMQFVIEWELELREGVTLEELQAKHIWPEDKSVNPDGFASILADVQKRVGDWDAAYREARRIYQAKKKGK